ncbi:MAG: bifunctional methylenetetrahydrofolate dehydrogenase/methenyltetrahydrofolate cyclohydrolase FolD [Alphaproteobacteria bacterium]|nr:bifunctional methylenetetrahydrofolate dehydrogenase/methenyltetrahydrofolate cyclohydrolase FolD [Alphaproteobacteria bacterium]
MTGATIIDGKAIAAALCRQVAQAALRLRQEHAVVPGLAAVLVGTDAASRVYVASKRRACEAAGLAAFDRPLPAETSEGALLAEIAKLAADGRVDGILVQLPLPSPLDAQRVLSALAPEKDVDGFHPINIGRLWSGLPTLAPCTPQGVLMLLRRAVPDLGGAEAVVLGRSNIVGRPLASLLLQANCTVTIAHSRTRDIAAISRRADIVIAAIGRPQAVPPDWIKPGATVIDVGINRVAAPEGGTRLVGDVDFTAVREIAGAITPVPGGVGPMTIACLLRNTVLAACRRRGLADPPELAE